MIRNNVALAIAHNITYVLANWDLLLTLNLENDRVSKNNLKKKIQDYLRGVCGKEWGDAFVLRVISKLWNLRIDVDSWYSITKHRATVGRGRNVRRVILHNSHYRTIGTCFISSFVVLIFHMS